MTRTDGPLGARRTRTRTPGSPRARTQGARDRTQSARARTQSWVLAALAMPAVLATAPSAAAPSAVAANSTGLGLVQVAVNRDEVDFLPPEPKRHEVAGVPVHMLEDRTLPLVTVYARAKGGYARFGKENHAAGVALPALLRYGGAAGIGPDSVDRVIDHYALQTTFGGGGEGVSASINTLSEFLPQALELWGAMLATPALDSSEVEVWRGRRLEQIRRRSDDPGSLAFTEFNRLMYGDHPIGWELGTADLTPERLSRERLARIHSRIVCRENLALGVIGDVGWDEFRPLAERFLARVAPCSDSLPASPQPEVARLRGVFVLQREGAAESVIVMAHPVSVRLADNTEYYSATIGNSILGSGGLSSRLMSRVRSEEGYAYSVSSLWTTPRRYDGLVGATTRTGPQNAASAANLILETMEELRTAEPTSEEVLTATEAIVNGFVFSFDSPGQIVARTMFFEAQGLPTDWLSRYVRGIQQVTPSSVHRVFSRHLKPDDMTTLIVGDTARMDMDALAGLGPVTILPRPGAAGSGP